MPHVIHAVEFNFSDYTNQCVYIGITRHNMEITDYRRSTEWLYLPIRTAYALSFYRYRVVGNPWFIGPWQRLQNELWCLYISFSFTRIFAFELEETEEPNGNPSVWSGDHITISITSNRPNNTFTLCSFMWVHSYYLVGPIAL